MQSRRIWGISLSTIVLSTLVACSQVMVAAPTPVTPVGKGGAKGMFYEQLKRPAEKLNNGMEYWIELKRNGASKQVSNKMDFRSGDQIRFHIKSNADTFAYIILREGSRGEKSVLFPDPRHADDNRLKANVEYTIPSDSYLEFDEFPGTEKVTLITSREKIEPDKYLPDAFKDKVIVAAHRDGSKDLVPGSFVVDYGTAPAAAPTASAAPAPVSTALASHNPASGSASAPGLSTDNIITVVQRNPAQVLAIDILLQHKP